MTQNTLQTSVYVPESELFTENHLCVYKAHHQILGKPATLWVHTMPCQVRQDMADRFGRQIGMQAAIYHPDIASIYTAGIEGNCLYYSQEPWTKGSLADEVRHRRPQTREEFYRMFNPLVDLLHSLNRLTVSWDRLTLNDIIVKTSTHYRIQRWNPFSEFDGINMPDGMGKTLSVQRGLYCAAENFNLDKNLQVLASWMYSAVTGNEASNLNKAIEDFQTAMKGKRKKNEPEPRFLADADPFIEHFIYRLAMPKFKGGFASMAEVEQGLTRLRRGEHLEAFPDIKSDSNYRIGGSMPMIFSDSKSSIGTVPVGSSTAPKAAARVKSKLPLILTVLAILALAGAVGGMIYYNVKNRNHAPTAQITLLQTTAKTHQKITFSGRASKDPDGDSLYYFWNVIEPTNATTDYHISQNRTQSARTTVIQFFRPGVYKVSLQVKDGEKFSEPVYTSITIKP